MVAAMEKEQHDRWQIWHSHGTLWSTGSMAGIQGGEDS